VLNTRYFAEACDAAQFDGLPPKLASFGSIRDLFARVKTMEPLGNKMCAICHAANIPAT